jgi:hypothetical protein
MIAIVWILVNEKGKFRDHIHFFPFIGRQARKSNRAFNKKHENKKVQKIMNLFVRRHCTPDNIRVSSSFVVRQCPTMSDNVRQCPTMSDNVRQCPTMSDNVRQCLTMPDNVRQCPTMPEIVRQCLTMPGNARQKIPDMADFKKIHSRKWAFRKAMPV